MLNYVTKVVTFSAVIPRNEAIRRIAAAAHIPGENVPSGSEESFSHSKNVGAIERALKSVRDDSELPISALMKPIQKNVTVRCFE
jgi:hypothetical protein